MEFDKEFLDKLFEQAMENPRLRQNFDLRTSPADTSQRMLNALLPGTVVPIHRHEDTTETVICLCGKLDEVIYEEVVSYEKDTDDFQKGMSVRLSIEKYSVSISILQKPSMVVRYLRVHGILWK